MISRILYRITIHQARPACREYVQPRAPADGTIRKETCDHRTGLGRLSCAERSGPGGDVPRAAARPGIGRGTSQAWSSPSPLSSPMLRKAHSGTPADLTGGPGDDGAFEFRVRPDAEPERLLVSTRRAAALCAIAVDRSPATARGFHPTGPADPSGFAGMARDEILVHTYDAGTGLGASFSPDPRLAGRLFRRLFPGLRSGSWSGLRSGPGSGLRSGSWSGSRSWSGLRPGSGSVGAAVGQRADRSPWQAAPGNWRRVLRTPGRVERSASCHRCARAMSRRRPRPRAGSVAYPGQARHQARLLPVSFVWLVRRNRCGRSTREQAGQDALRPRVLREYGRPRDARRVAEVTRVGPAVVQHDAAGGAGHGHVDAAVRGCGVGIPHQRSPYAQANEDEEDGPDDDHHGALLPAGQPPLEVIGSDGHDRHSVGPAAMPRAPGQDLASAFLLPSVSSSALLPRSAQASVPSVSSAFLLRGPDQDLPARRSAQRSCSVGRTRTSFTATRRGRVTMKLMVSAMSVASMRS